ncbi:MAG: arginyltransferase [Deltaproteobacteria bacterium]|nr:arginyltransferase [Deltaproteobacteria bacterium]
MARLLEQIVSPPQPCTYLPGLEAVMETRVMLEVSAAELDALLARGWRRFGPTYFRPRCRACAECVSLRVPVNTFAPTHSQLRALRKCRDVEVHVGVPRVDTERMDLYHRWHAMREADRGWTGDTVTHEQYAMQFCFPHPAAREMTYRLDGKLIGVGIVDETPAALSSVYFYFDPQHRRLSLGVASALLEIAHAQRRGRRWLYLGYRVQACPSLQYKGTFGPHELLVGRPEPDDEPRWVPPPEHPLAAPPAADG